MVWLANMLKSSLGLKLDNGLIRTLLLRFSHCAYNGESDIVQR